MEFTNVIVSTDYLSYMKELFSVCTNKAVIELAPFGGWHTELILANKPASMTLVEPNPAATADLRTKFTSPDVDILTDDAHLFYQSEHKADVVVCCGLLYHIHSTLMLLEEIVNQSDPDVIVIDNVPSPSIPILLPEEDNIDGNRFTMNNWKSCRLSLVLSYPDIELAMKNLGYMVSYYDSNLIRFKCDSKRGWVAIFKKAVDDN